LAKSQRRQGAFSTRGYGGMPEGDALNEAITFRHRFLICGFAAARSDVESEDAKQPTTNEALLMSI
jgi:hypothetical protein